MKAILKNRHINLPKIRKRTEEAFNESIITEGY